jgi:hypothetical protein
LPHGATVLFLSEFSGPTEAKLYKIVRSLTRINSSASPTPEKTVLNVRREGREGDHGPSLLVQTCFLLLLRQQKIVRSLNRINTSASPTMPEKTVLNVRREGIEGDHGPLFWV